MKMLITLLLLIAGSVSYAADDKVNPVDLQISYEEFSSWPIPIQKAYWRQLRGAWANYERASQKGMKMASEEAPSDWQVAFKSVISVFQIEPAADAADSKPTCPVGGWEREMVEEHGELFCPTTGKPCGKLGKRGFQCGVIFDSACVPRTPVENLTERCQKAAGDVMPDKSQYDSVQAQLNGVATRCRSGAYIDRFKPVCEAFTDRLTKVRSDYGALVTQKQPAQVPVKTQAKRESPSSDPGSVNACFPPVGKVIKNNPGGRIDLFLNAAAKLRSSGKSLEIDGLCASACTFYAASLPPDRVCVGPHAALGFHDAAFPQLGAAGQIVGMTPDRRYTESVYQRVYKGKMLQFWNKHKNDYADHLKLKLLKGQELESVFKPCAQAKNELACTDTGSRYASRPNVNSGDGRAEAAR